MPKKTKPSSILSEGHFHAGFETSKVLRRLLDVLVIFFVLTQVIFVLVILAGDFGKEVLPLSGGAVISMFLVSWFYARWLYPMLEARHILAILAIKEIAILLVCGLIAGLLLGIDSMVHF